MSLRELREWWDALPPQLRPEPGADPSKKDYGYFLQHMTHAWERNGREILEVELASNGRELTAEFRSAGQEFLAWIQPIVANFENAVAERLAEIHEECRNAIAEHARQAAANPEWAAHFLDQNFAGRVDGSLLPIAFIRTLLACDNPAPPRTWAKIANHVRKHEESFSIFANDPWHMPLNDAIGSRIRDLRLREFDFNTGVWASWPSLDTDGYTDHQTGENVPGENWQGPVMAAESIWREALTCFPIRTLQRIRFHMVESPWFAAYTLNCLMNADDHEHFGGAVLLIWELSRPYKWWCGDDSKSSPLNPWEDWFVFRRFRHHAENLRSQDARGFALACGFLVDRILNLAARIPIPANDISTGFDFDQEFAATTAVVNVDPTSPRRWRELSKPEKGEMVIRILTRRENPLAPLPPQEEIAIALQSIGTIVERSAVGNLLRDPPENLRLVLERIAEENRANIDERERELRDRARRVEPNHPD